MRTLVILSLLICGVVATADETPTEVNQYTAEQFLEQIYAAERIKNFSSTLTPCRRATDCKLDSESCTGYQRKRRETESTFPFKDVETERIGVCCKQSDKEICLERIPSDHSLVYRQK